MLNVATYLQVKHTSRRGLLTFCTAGKSIQYCFCPVLIPCFEGTAVYDGVKSFERVWGREGERKREERRLRVEEKTCKSPDVSEQRLLAFTPSRERPSIHVTEQRFWHCNGFDLIIGTKQTPIEVQYAMEVSFRVQRIIISLVKWSITSRQGLKIDLLIA
jgi:hypothetical protein